MVLSLCDGVQCSVRAREVVIVGSTRGRERIKLIMHLLGTPQTVSIRSRALVITVETYTRSRERDRCHSIRRSSMSNWRNLGETMGETRGSRFSRTAVAVACRCPELPRCTIGAAHSQGWPNTFAPQSIQRRAAAITPSLEMDRHLRRSAHGA